MCMKKVNSMMNMIDFILDDLLDEEGLIKNELYNIDIDIELIEPESDLYLYLYKSAKLTWFHEDVQLIDY